MPTVPEYALQAEQALQAEEAGWHRVNQLIIDLYLLGRRTVRQQLITMLVRDEGYRPFPYTCPAGKLTIGIGRNLEDAGINHEEAVYLLRSDIERIDAALLQKVPCYIGLSEARQAVLINMAFNMGVAGLLGFKNMLEALEIGDYWTAAHEMANSMWAHQVPERARRLMDVMRSDTFNAYEQTGDHAQ